MTISYYFRKRQHRRKCTEAWQWEKSDSEDDLPLSILKRATIFDDIDGDSDNDPNYADEWTTVVSKKHKKVNIIRFIVSHIIKLI